MRDLATIPCSHLSHVLLTPWEMLDVQGNDLCSGVPAHSGVCSSPWPMCAGHQHGSKHLETLGYTAQVLGAKAEISLGPNKTNHKSSQWLPHFPFFPSAVSNYWPVIGIRMLNWANLLWWCVQSYILIISSRHSSRSVSFNLVHDLASKIWLKSHTVLAQAVFYTYNWGKSGAKIKQNNSKAATSQTIMQIIFLKLLGIILNP